MAAEYQSLFSFPYSITHSATNTVFERPHASMKRRFLCDDSSSEDDYGDDDDYVSRPKRFLSEEAMTSHMQQLYLATPPHSSSALAAVDDAEEVKINQLGSGCGISSDSTIDVIKEGPMVAPQPLIIQQDAVILSDDPGTTDCAKQSVKDQGAAVTMEDISDDSSSDNEDSVGVRVWIAPEMEEIMNKKALMDGLLPDDILNNIKKALVPCQALVPYVSPQVKPVHSVWSDSGSVDEDGELVVDHPEKLDKPDDTKLEESHTSDEDDSENDMEL